MNTDAHHLNRAQIIALFEENATLREENRQLQEALVPTIILPRKWRLSRMQELLLRTLRGAGGNVVHRERAMLALYGTWDDAPDQKIIDVVVCQTRRRLMEAQARVTIETIWGRGWRLTADAIRNFDAAILEDRVSIPWVSDQPFMIAAE